MGKVIGLGGPFVQAEDPKKLAQWYEENLGIAFNGGTYAVMPFTHEDDKPTAGFNIFTFFTKDNKYFEPSKKAVMINLRVEDLPGLLETLKQKGVAVVGNMEDSEYGKFAWILDPEDNKVELWEPPV